MNTDAIFCYVYAAWNSVSATGGCYDYSGHTLRQSSSFRRYVASALVAEAISVAVLAGVKDLICF